MTNEQKAAYVIAQGIAALAEIESMKAANQMREMLGETIAYGEDAFLEITEKYGLGHGSLIGFFHD